MRFTIKNQTTAFPVSDWKRNIVALFFLVMLFTITLTPKVLTHDTQRSMIIAGTGVCLAAVMIAYEIISLLLHTRHGVFDILVIFRLYLWLIGLGTFLFSLMYILDSNNFVGEIHNDHVMIDFGYFTITLVSTIGLGDITPKSVSCRVVTMTFIIFSMFVNVVVIQLLFAKFRYDPILTKIASG